MEWFSTMSAAAGHGWLQVPSEGQDAGPAMYAMVISPLLSMMAVILGVDSVTPRSSSTTPPQHQDEAKPVPTSAGQDESDLDTLRSVVQQIKSK